MRFPAPVSSSVPSRPATTRPRRGRPVLLLVLVAIVLAAATAVLGHDAGLVALGLSTAALLAAAVLQLRAQWLAMIDERPVAPAAEPAGTTSARLRLLRDRYLAAVDDALDAGDHGRARELADAYPDEALRVLTA